MATRREATAQRAKIHVEAALHAWDQDDREQTLSHTRAAREVLESAGLGDTGLAGILSSVSRLLRQPGTVSDWRWREAAGGLDVAGYWLAVGAWNREDVSDNPHRPRRRRRNPDASLGVLGHAAAGAAVGAVAVGLLRGQSAETELTDLSMAAGVAAIVGYLIGGRKAILPSSIGGLGGAFVAARPTSAQAPLLPSEGTA